ncbi:MAG TPA: SRPBCC domain-containing protein [Chryseolinea sp.]
MSATRNSKLIHTSPEKLYHAFTNPTSLEHWQAPGDMNGKVHHFDLRAGGGYEMSLFYSTTDKTSRGKTAGKEDRFKARFVELDPPTKIVEAIIFDSPDPAFAGEMIMEVTFEPEGPGTRVTIAFKNIPAGINPKDNETGTELSLEKLARYTEGH